MQGKRIVTIALLLFVAVSVFALIKQETRKPKTTATAGQPVAEQPTGDAAVVDRDARKQPATASVQPGSDKELSASRVVVYYFHGKTRCYTCKMIESLAREAVTSTFGAELKSGRVVFQSVNVEEPANEHFVNDFKLSTRSVVLARYSGNTQESWKNLDRVWMLVRDPAAYYRYVADETRQMLGGA